MKKMWIATLLFAANAFASVDCTNVNKVAAEAIAYSLVGAWRPFTTHACFKNEKFEYFKPQLGSASGDMNGNSIHLFDKKTDRYVIESIKKDGLSYKINVSFTIAGRPLHTNYFYRPDPEYAKKHGICGYVVNYDDGIFRKDCMIPGRLPATKK